MRIGAARIFTHMVTQLLLNAGVCPTSLMKILLLSILIRIPADGSIPIQGLEATVSGTGQGTLLSMPMTIRKRSRTQRLPGRDWLRDQQFVKMKILAEKYRTQIMVILPLCSRQQVQFTPL